MAPLTQSSLVLTPGSGMADSLLLQSSKAPTNWQNAPINKPAPIVDLPTLQSASRVLQDQFTRDAQSVPDLGDTLSTPGSQSSSSYTVPLEDSKVPYQKSRLLPVPDSLFNYVNTTNLVSHLGLFPEIERAYITIDHKLFLWNYLEGDELSSYVDQPDVITRVALVKPKPGVFIDEISHILVICTPITILLIGVSSTPAPGRNGRPHNAIQLFATDMSVSIDSEMNSVAGTVDGRIFLTGADDGNLYELHYQESESWFGKRVQLINHSVSGMSSLFPRLTSRSEDRLLSVVADPLRNCLYTLSSSNTISLYQPNGAKSVQHVQTLSNLYKLVQEKAPGTPSITPQTFHIISIHVVSPLESRTGMQLVAITSNGARLFFSSASIGYNYGYASGTPASIRPIQLVHVRLPPSNLLHPDDQEKAFRPPPSITYGSAQLPQPSIGPYILTALDVAAYSNGLTIACQPGERDSTDFVLCMSPDLTHMGTLGQSQIPSQQAAYNPSNYGSAIGTTRPPLTEYVTLLEIPGRAFAAAPVARTPLLASIAGNSAPAPTVMNELATQWSESPPEFMILTNIGLSFLTKRRALDHLKAVLEDFQTSGKVHPVLEFRDSFGRDQTCAMLLALASGNTFLEPDSSLKSGALQTLGPDLATVAKQAFYDFGERPMWAERANFGTSEAQGTAIFSGRREGLALYLARLLWPIWKVKLTSPAPLGLQRLNLSDGQLVIIHKNLSALKEFLDNNPHLFQSTPGDPSGVRAGNTNDAEAWKVEKASVAQLQALLHRSLEGISFVLLLHDYHLEDLIGKCDAEIQQLVASMTFEELITSQNGLNASRGLVNVIIDQQIGQQISVETISDILQQRCGSFCSTDDVMLYKAKENVRKAVEAHNPSEKHRFLEESLRLYTMGARVLEFDRIREICGDYQQLNFAKGAVELPLSCASVLDPDNIGLEYWGRGCPSEDSRSEFCDRRIQCYDLVLDSLAVFEEKSNKSTASPSSGPNDPETVRSHAFELAFASNDEMFHSVFYDWLIGRGVADELLQMQPPYLEAHLRREPISVQNYQLLWQFYVKAGQPLRAAEVLSALAESTQFDLSLNERLEYLTLAVGNAKSHPISADGRHETAIAFLTDLEEKLDVAQVQLEVFNALIPRIDEPDPVGIHIKALSQRLFTISELYQEYADPFDLPNMKLLILHVSEHRDETIVKPIWNQIFEKAIEGVEDPIVAADALMAKMVPLGRRFYPSESAFPTQHVAMLLTRFALAHKNTLPQGWVARMLTQCSVAYSETWDIFNEMYESQIPPFNDQDNVQAVSSEIAVLLSDWLEEAKRPQPSGVRSEFPVGRIDLAIDQYLRELHPSRTESRQLYESIKRQLRRNW